MYCADADTTTGGKQKHLQRFVGRIIRALTGGGTGLVVVTLRSSILQSLVPCCAVLSNGALGPNNELILAQISLPVPVAARSKA